MNNQPDSLIQEFKQLQEKLAIMWPEIGSKYPAGPVQRENSVVVLPPLSVDVSIGEPLRQDFEERFLFMLFLLRQPHIRIIYLTSQPIEPAIIDYYLDILPGVIMSNARKRLFLVSPHDASQRPLSSKLLDRPHLLQEIRDLIPDPDNAHIVPFNTTDLEREVAVRLGIPMYAADPDFFAFGTKSGGRHLFVEEGIDHPLGEEDLFSAQEIVQAIVNMRGRKPHMKKVIVKLNEGVGGMGNAVVDLQGLPTAGHAAESEAIAARLAEMQFEVKDTPYESYIDQLEANGGIVEELIIGDELFSPSAQLRISPTGDLEMLSTHDQLLGGPTGQTYLGAIFPARPEYSRMIMEQGAIIGRRLAREGIVGRFAVDFLVVRNGDGWDSYAIEINLRKGGTTAPYLTLQYLTSGLYHAAEGDFITAMGQKKYYVANDHLVSEAYRVLRPQDLFDIISEHRLHFDHSNQTGIVLHMISGVGSFGGLGLTAIANSPQDADLLYQRFVNTLDEEARQRLL